MITVHRISGYDETGDRLHKLAGKLIDNGRCIIAHGIVLQEIETRNMQMDMRMKNVGNVLPPPAVNARGAQSWNEWVINKERKLQ